jgi:Na+/melibiose symporter-like transporter
VSRSTGYVSGAASQPDSAVAAIRLAAGPVPAALIIGAIAVMSAYPLTEEKFREIVHEVAERRATRRVQEAR